MMDSLPRLNTKPTMDPPTPSKVRSHETLLTPHGKRPRMETLSPPGGTPRGAEGIMSPGAIRTLGHRSTDEDPGRSPKKRKELAPEEKAQVVAERRHMIKREVVARLKKGTPLQKLLTKIGVHFTVHHNSKNVTPLSDRELLRRFKGYLDQTDSDTIDVLVSNLSIYDTLEKYKRRKPKLPHSDDPINDVAQLFKTSNRIMVVSGAGISVSCGVPDFRSRGGLYERIKREMNLSDPQDIFDFELFRSDPSPFYSICKDLFPKETLHPSPSHYFIKLLEEKRKLLRNYTQNIDTLERKAGLRRIMHCHGSFATASCIQCGFRVDGSSIREEVLSDNIPKCVKCPTDQGVMKPDIVFFNEPLSKKFDLALDKDLDKVDLLVVMGSSLRVQPVSIIPEEVRDANSEVPQILINKELVGEQDQFDYFLQGECDAIIVEICKRLGWNLPLPPVPATPLPPQPTTTTISSSVTVVSSASSSSASLSASSSSIIVVDSPPTPPLSHDEEIALSSTTSSSSSSSSSIVTIDVTSTSPPASPLSLFLSSSPSAGLIATVVKDESATLSSPSPSPPTLSSLLHVSSTSSTSISTSLSLSSASSVSSSQSSTPSLSRTLKRIECSESESES